MTNLTAAITKSLVEEEKAINIVAIKFLDEKLEKLIPFHESDEVSIKLDETARQVEVIKNQVSGDPQKVLVSFDELFEYFHSSKNKEIEMALWDAVNSLPKRCPYFVRRFSGMSYCPLTFTTKL